MATHAGTKRTRDPAENAAGTEYHPQNPRDNCCTPAEPRPSKRRASPARVKEFHGDFVQPEWAQSPVESTFETCYEDWCRTSACASPDCLTRDTCVSPDCLTKATCVSPDCLTKDACYDPNCTTQECADQCSDPECLKGLSPDAICFCTKCCMLQCQLAEPTADCHRAHSNPDPSGTVYCFNNAPCHFSGSNYTHPVLPAFQGHSCTDETHGTLDQCNVTGSQSSTATPFLSPDGYSSVGSMLSTLPIPGSRQASTVNYLTGFDNDQSLPGFPHYVGGSKINNDLPSEVLASASLWDLYMGQHGAPTSSDSNLLLSTGSTTPSDQPRTGQPCNQFVTWEGPASIPAPMIRPADFGQAAPRAASKVAFRGKNGLDFLASAVQQESLLKLDISTSTKESTPTHPDTTSPASAIRTPEPPLHICKWHTSNTGPCLQIFETPEALHKHLKAAHVENCSACFCQWDSCESRDKDFKQRSKLSRHLLGHAGYRPYACTWKDCDKTFATNQAKDNHERTHTGVKPYVCSQCGYQTTTHTQLYTHINARHDGKKKHKCRHCDFTCADSSNLSKHERTHNQHRPYRCPNDGCAFKPDCRWENLKRHLRKSKHCPELLEEGSPANKAYKERVRREKEEWERMAAGIGLRTGTVTPGVGVGVGERQMSGNGAEGLG